MSKLQRYFYNLALVCDLGLNAISGGSPRETCSSRLWRHREVAGVLLLIRIIDVVAYYAFGQVDHCRTSQDDACYFDGQEVLP